MIFAVCLFVEDSNS